MAGKLDRNLVEMDVENNHDMDLDMDYNMVKEHTDRIWEKDMEIEMVN